jgi:hypothetical protein
MNRSTLGGAPDHPGDDGSRDGEDEDYQWEMLQEPCTLDDDDQQEDNQNDATT